MHTTHLNPDYFIRWLLVFTASWATVLARGSHIGQCRSRERLKERQSWSENLKSVLHQQPSGIQRKWGSSHRCSRRCIKQSQEISTVEESVSLHCRSFVMGSEIHVSDLQFCCQIFHQKKNSFLAELNFQYSLNIPNMTPKYDFLFS